MKFHHDKHHQAYITNVNAALANYPELAAKPVDDLIADLAAVPDAIKAAVIPGATGFAGNQYTWDCAMDLEGHGHPSGSKQVVVQITGTMTQEGGHYNAAKVKAGVAYDPAARLPIFVSETRSRIPQTSVYNKDLVQLQLQSSSGTMPAPQPATPAPAPKAT